MKKSDCTAQEQWVLEQLEKGETADLKAQFGEAEADRRLRARFLEELLTDGIEDFQPHRRGLRMAHAVIADPLDLENAEVSHIVSFKDSIFEKEANFRDARFGRHLFLNRTLFHQRAYFHRLIVVINLFLRDAVFQGPVDFGNADIGGQFSAEGAQFKSEAQEANFNAMKVGQDAFFRDTVFQGPVDFGTADIGRQFIAKGAQFKSEAQEANFNAMKVGQSAFFDKAVFQGAVDFVTADIGGQFSAKEAQFNSEKEKANFNAMKVGQSAFFDQAVFQGPVDFVTADIGRQFSAKGAHFKSEAQKANFNAMKVGQSAFFDNAEFQGPVDFGGADIGGHFVAKGAQFASAEQEANFNGMKVGDIAFFQNSHFQGGVALNDGHFLDLLLSGPPVPGIELERTRVDREFAIQGMAIARLAARSLEVKGPASFIQATFEEECDLRDCRFQQLTLVDNTWPEKGEVSTGLWLDGLTFHSLSTRRDPEQPENWEMVIQWLSLSRLNTQSYSQVEEYFQRGGQREWAYKLFIEGQRRAWKKRQGFLGKYLIKIFWDWLAGYGRKPGRTLYCSAAVVALGFFLLNPAYFVSPKAMNLYHGSILWIMAEWLKNGVFCQSLWNCLTDALSWKSLLVRLSLSFDLFLPKGILGLTEGWSLASLPLPTMIYVLVHKICGAIFIPIGVAGVFTRIR